MTIYTNIEQTMIATVAPLTSVDTVIGTANGTTFRVSVLDSDGCAVSQGTYDELGMCDSEDANGRYAVLDATELGPFLTRFLAEPQAAPHRANGSFGGAGESTFD